MHYYGMMSDKILYQFSLVKIREQEQKKKAEQIEAQYPGWSWFNWKCSQFIFSLHYDKKKKRKIAAFFFSLYTLAFIEA